MSQPPAFPPQGFPEGFTPPPSPSASYSLPAVQRTSAAAITSLICGILCCIPLLTGLIAVITGIIGIRATSSPSVKGRAAAIAGLILGLLSLVLWGGAALLVKQHLRTSGPEHDFAMGYFKDIQAQNFDAALANSTDKMTESGLRALADEMKPWGKLDSCTLLIVNVTNDQYVGVGSCQFSSGGSRSFQTMLVRDPTGALKVDAFAWNKRQDSK